jgi:hypothetical protein
LLGELLEFEWNCTLLVASCSFGKELLLLLLLDNYLILIHEDVLMLLGASLVGLT